MKGVEKGKTAKYLREKRGVSDQAKEKLKAFNRIKKQIVDALSEEELTIEQLGAKLNIPKSDIVYQIGTLVKYGVLAVGDIDDMDEYFTYKLNK